MGGSLQPLVEWLAQAGVLDPRRGLGEVYADFGKKLGISGIEDPDSAAHPGDLGPADARQLSGPTTGVRRVAANTHEARLFEAPDELDHQRMAEPQPRREVADSERSLFEQEQGRQAAGRRTDAGFRQPTPVALEEQLGEPPKPVSGERPAELHDEVYLAVHVRAFCN